MHLKQQVVISEQSTSLGYTILHVLHYTISLSGILLATLYSYNSLSLTLSLPDKPSLVCRVVEFTLSIINLVHHRLHIHITNSL
jgi:hypothetical protein